MTDFLPLAGRRIIAVAGPDADDFLQGLVSQKVSRDGPAFAALLTPQGKILFDFLLIPAAPEFGEDGYLIDVAADAAADLHKRLRLYKLRAKVALTVREDLSVAVAPGMTDPSPQPGAFLDPRLAALGARMIVKAPAPDQPIHDADYARFRRGLGAPECVADFPADSHFLMDVNYDALHGVDYQKGCFVGQEVASRMKRKGEIRKRTYRLEAAGAIAPGAEIKAETDAGESTVGTVLAVDGSIGLALVRVDRLAKAGSATPGGALTIAGAPAQLTPPAYLEKATP